ncbi:NADP-specific glutamate dehydrogenase [Clostridium transplantifaecale]|uniref:NADP-specific glutamate dehydrogenase n=1 Tax=Clostridium transplantifaecale TaxID=2479838 RepID=UPI000F63A9D3|nr:NADP-specific glutamate dehydrogenase [Clostridium transplantifaecale]
MSYVDEVYRRTVEDNPGEFEFHQAVREILESLKLVIDSDEKKYRDVSLLERLIEPERIISFRVPWVDDRGHLQINKGYRIQYNSAIGPYKGGLRFHSSVNLNLLKFVGFEQTFKNALTGLPIGGAKGGSNFDRKGKSDREIMAFCQSFMSELFKYIGDDLDILGGDIGAGAREIGYLFGQYKRLAGLHCGAMTGKGPSFGGSPIRTQATGYGLVYMLENLLRRHGKGLDGKVVVISGAGSVAVHTIEKIQQYGAKVVTLSDSDGYIYDKDGIRLDVVKQIKEVRRGRIKEYLDEVPSAIYEEKKSIWDIPCHIALPCATQNEINLNAAKTLVRNGCIALAEGANMPCDQEATEFFQQSGVLFMPGKAANGGGVAVSTLEMRQNSMRTSWTFDEVDGQLHKIMSEIYDKTSDTAERYGVKGNFVAGANIAAFEKIAEAMMAQGFV